MGWFNDQIRERMRSDQEVFEDSFVKIAGSVLGGQEAQRLRDERLIAKAALPALVSFVNPLITWLLLRKRWDRWPKIEEQRTAANRRTRKPKSRKTALILAALPWTGFLGVDRFYLGYVGIGLLKFFTAGVFFVLYILDIVKIARGTMRDKYGRPLV